MKRRVLIIAILILLAVSVNTARLFLQSEPIRIGVIHSLSGTMAFSEENVKNATLLAIAEINANGGVLGRNLEPIVIDGESDWDLFATETERLIVEEEVSVIFGCWTSACRKTVRPVFEQYNHLLFYPVQYEGLETSPNIIYTGAAPNQQLIPAVGWAMENLGQSFYLVGSDYVFPRTANEIMRRQILAADASVVGEAYILLGETEVSAIVEDIIASQPDVILNTINGDSNIAFFNALRDAGITSVDIPTISFSIAEPELQALPLDALMGDYAAWNYFQSIESAQNERFVEAYRARYGADAVISDPMEAAYFGVYLWAQSVEIANSVEPALVREAIRNQSFNAPNGIVTIDAETQHTWKPVRIGQIEADGQFAIVWDSEHPVRPIPFPQYATRAEWDSFLSDLYIGWGNAWANPGENN